MMREGDFIVRVLRGLGIIGAVTGAVALCLAAVMLALTYHSFAWVLGAVFVLYFAYQIGGKS